MTTSLVLLGYKCPATLNLGVNMCLCSTTDELYTHSKERERKGGILRGVELKVIKAFELHGASRRTNQEMEETCCVKIIFVTRMQQILHNKQ